MSVYCFHSDFDSCNFQGSEKSFVCQNKLEIGVNYKNTIGCLHTTD